MRRLNVFLFRLFVFLACSLGGNRSYAQSAESLDVLPPPLYPVCEALYPLITTPTIGGSTTDRPFGGLYCITDSLTLEANDSLVLARLNEELAQIGQIERLEISANYFDSAVIAEWLCSLNISSQSELVISVQNFIRAEENQEAHLTSEFHDRISNCFRRVTVNSVGCDLFGNGAWAMACPEGQTNSHHIKGAAFLGRSGALYIFGSGNFSEASLFRNIENWVILRSTEQVPLLDCIFSFSRTLGAHPELRFSQQRDIFRGCTALSPRLPNVDVFVLPFNEREYRQEIERRFSTARSVVIVGQFIESAWLLSLIENSSHAEVTLLLDDAYYYSSIDPEGKGFNFVNPQQAAALLEFVERLPHVKVRFLQTNHHFSENGQTNTVHARSILFEGGPEIAMMIGSAHFRDGSMRSNTEQQFILRNDAAMIYKVLIDDLLDRSIELEGLPVGNTAATPQ